MSGFIYKASGKDRWGHKYYICDCSICGNEVEYRRLMNKPAICGRCMKEKADMADADRKKKHDDEIWNQAIDEFSRWLFDKKYITTDNWDMWHLDREDIVREFKERKNG